MTSDLTERNKAERQERRIMLIGAVWIIAGSVSVALWLYISAHTACSCPAIPVNATPQEIARICPCLSNEPLFVGIGALAVALWIAVAMLRKKLAAYVYSRPQK